MTSKAEDGYVQEEEEDLGLRTEKLICLHKERIEMAKICNDIDTMMNSCQQFVWHCNSKGRHAESLRCLKEILPSAVVIPSYELIVHKYLSLTYEELKEFDNEVFHAKKWIEIARNIGDKGNEIFGNIAMGNVFLSLARYDDAIDCSKQCLEIAQETGSAEGEMMAYNYIMDAYKCMQKHDETILYAHKLLDCATKTNDQKTMMDAYLELERAHLALNHFQDAIEFGKKFIEIAREIEDRCGEVSAYLLMGQIYNGLSNYDNAIIYYKKCIELAITIGAKHAEARAYFGLGEVYYSLKKYDDAISNCNKCVHIDKEDNEDKAVDVVAYMTLGRVNESLEKYDDAIQNYKQCIDIANHIGHEKDAEVIACLCLGKIYDKLEQYNDAVYYSKKCIDMAQETGEKNFEAQACFILGQIYNRLEQYNDTVYYSKKCIEIAQETGEKRFEAQACFILGQIYNRLEQYNDAVYYSKKCIYMAQGANDKKTQMNGHYLLAEVYLCSMQLNNVSLSIDAGMAIATQLGDTETEEKFSSTRRTLYAIVGFLDVSASVKRELLGVPTCSEDDLLEDFACNDIDTMVYYCKQFVLHSNNIGRHADSLRCLKEILPSAVVIPSYELIVHKYLSWTYDELKEFDNEVFHAKKWVEIAGNIGNKENEILGNLRMGAAFLSSARYDDAIDCSKQCLEIAQETNNAEGEMIAYNCIMDAYKCMQKHDETILYAHKLLDCAIKTNDQNAMMNAYSELERAHLALNHFQDAIEFGEKTIEIAREIEDRCGEAWAYLLMGQIYKARSDYDNAIIYYKKCIKLAITIGDKNTEAYAYFGLGDIYCSLEKYDDAISNCNKCVHIDKEDNEDKAADAIAYLTLGRANESLEKYDESIQNYKQCIDIVNLIGREKKAAVRACYHLGGIYMKLEQHDDAVYYSKKCIEMGQETGDKSFEAQACFILGQIYKTLEQYNDAVYYSKKCIDMAQGANDKKTQMNGHYLLAEVYLGLMQLNDMSLNIDAGMAIATELGDTGTEKQFRELRSILNGAVGFLDIPRPDSVDELLDVSTCSEDDLLGDLAQAVKTGDKEKKVIASFRLHKFYFAKKDYGKSINFLRQLKEMDINCAWNLLCFLEIGRSHRLMGQNDMALRCYKEGLPTAESSSDNLHRYHFYYDIGKLLFSLNKELNLAERYLREAIRCFEAIFTTLGSRDEFKISIFDRYINSYKVLAILLMKGEQMEEALLVLDRCRARALKDLMISNFKMEQEESNDEYLEYSDVLSMVSRNDFIISYYSICSNCFLKFFLGEEKKLHFSLKSISISIHDFLQIFVYKLFDEMGVLEVVNCEDRSLDKEQDIQKEQKRSEEEYEGLNQPTASLLNLDSKRGESNENSAETKGSTLEVLFGILECDRILSSKQDEVVVIPEGPLYQVPFPALRDPRTGKYLSETKRIRLAPSLATLKGLTQSSASYHDMKKGALVIGDPLVGPKVMFNGEEKKFHPLKHAFREARAVADLLRVTPLTGETATKSAVIESLKQGVAVVHIAAHGSLTKGTIALAPSPEIRATKIPDEEDYMLTMADVQQAKVRAQLVVLSCCHSGRGEIRAEGVVGMCRAFLASGARAVVASLWAIDDEATLEFMIEFYCYLIDGKSASASLQQAMEEMRNTTSYSKPKYWAPFFLMGDDVTLKL